MVSIKDMALSKKLIGGFSLVVILLVIVGFLGYNGVNTINSELDDILSNDVPMANNIAGMQTHLSKMTENPLSIAYIRVSLTNG